MKWGPLNPARGDKGPKAGNLWGDRTGSGPSGFLVRFADGFASPPHIHNVSYRGVVIDGLVHNDDPNADDMWMPAGSFWTQPAGGVHITSVSGGSGLAYIEIEDGPYLVRPPEQAFGGEDTAVNLDESNLVWLDASDIAWMDRSASPPTAHGPKVAFLWGSPQEDRLNGTLVALPAGFIGTISSDGASLHAVVIEGRPGHRLRSETGVQNLTPGSYFGSEGETVHQLSCEAEEGCTIYVRTEGKFAVTESQSKQ